MAGTKGIKTTLHAISIDKVRQTLKCCIKFPDMGTTVTIVDDEVIGTYGTSVLLLPATEDSIRKPWQKKAVPDWGAVSVSVLGALNQRTIGRKS